MGMSQSFDFYIVHQIESQLLDIFLEQIQKFKSNDRQFGERRCECSCSFRRRHKHPLEHDDDDYTLVVPMSCWSSKNVVAAIERANYEDGNGNIIKLLRSPYIKVP